LNGVVHVSSLGKAQKLEKGSHQLVSIDWIHHDNTAYFFPISQEVSLQNEEVTGTWWRINKQIDSSKEEIRKGVFKTWINHGESPDNASYQYLVRPNTSLEKLLVGEVNNPIQILSNTPHLQAAIHTDLKLVQGVFYRAGQLEVGAGLKVQATAPCILLIQMDSEDKILQITASDPNRELSSLLLKVNKKFEGSSKSFRSYWNTDEGWSEIIINLPQNGYAGQSVVIP
jgi:chondroitin AC lyase